MVHRGFFLSGCQSVLLPRGDVVTIEVSELEGLVTYSLAQCLADEKHVQIGEVVAVVEEHPFETVERGRSVDVESTGVDYL